LCQKGSIGREASIVIPSFVLPKLPDLCTFCCTLFASMNDEIQKLITSLRIGDYTDPAEKISLLSAALMEHNADLALLLSLLRAPQAHLRLAAMVAAAQRSEPEIHSEVVALVDDQEERVRCRLAELLIHRSDAAATDALAKLAGDSAGSVRTAAIRSMSGRPMFREFHEKVLANDIDWNVRIAAVSAVDSSTGHEAVSALAAALCNDDDSDIQRRCAEIIERRITEFPTETENALPVDIGILTKLKVHLKSLGESRFPKFVEWLESTTASKVDTAFLAKYGTDLTALAENGTLPHAHHVDAACQTILKLVGQTPARSIALLGPAGVGKSSVVHEIVYRLALPEFGWRVLRVSPSDFMSGTRYLGEWETKVRELVTAIRHPRRVLLYIPNLSELSAAGTWSKSDSSVATALAPYMDDGSILVLGESTPDEFERGLGKTPSLRRLFDQVLLGEPDVERTREILTAVRDEQGSKTSDQVLGQLIEVSGQFLGHISRPGNAVELLRAVLKSEKESGRPLEFRDVLDALSRSTGIPANLLDDSVALKQDETEHFFESKILGQPRAVEAVVDLVTLIKAGVTDPNRPFGVFMFAGPTGVGKTELARALAEFIFGDAARLKRFDMSEFANQDGFTRLIGTQTENGLLTDVVRQQPFSVVLLDEIEKAHINVFDLCLQLFDAGRLTDGRGRTVDFRRTIIILTSNVGAATGLLGFGATNSARNEKPTKDETSTELSRFFRPEFLNRLDRIIQFAPLSLAVAEQIARKEIQAVLQRGGIRRRELVVEVDSGVVSLIVKEGYSPRFGARPLKRTVERLLLLPIARAISNGSLQKSSMLRLSLQSGRVRISATAPDAAMPSHQKPPVAQSRASEKLSELHSRYTQLDDAIQAMAARKSKLLRQTHEPDFSRNLAVRASVLNEIHNIDEFFRFYDSVGSSLKGGVDARRREEFERLQLGVDHLAFVARCEDTRSLGDAVVIVSLVKRNGESQDAVRKIAGMYEALASRRRLAVEVLGEMYSNEMDHIYILVSGLGAFGLLKNEAGLHQVDRRYKQRNARASREVMREDRELVRVNVNPVPLETAAQFQKLVKTRVSALKPHKKRMVTADFVVNLLHEPSLCALEFWTHGPKEAAVERGLMILAASVESNGQPIGSPGIIRQYDLGLAAKIKDNRSGRETTRVEQVLKGDLKTLMDS
jgi:ATP-dependent Clp protease ATP-binding subunit ClpC